MMADYNEQHAYNLNLAYNTSLIELARWSKREENATMPDYGLPEQTQATQNRQGIIHPPRFVVI